MRTSSPILLTTLALGTLLLVACSKAPTPDGNSERDQGRSPLGAATERAAREAEPSTHSEEPYRPRESVRPPRVVFLGDSLTAGFGLSEEQAFPAIIGRRLESRGVEVTIVNAGISGDTTAGGLSRTGWLLRQTPDLLVVGLGANDGLRGLSPKMTEENLRAILTKALEAGSLPLLLGMRLPPNLGPDYVESFESIYPRLAEDLGVTLVPFLLEGVAGNRELNLPDGIHPTAEGQQIVADTIEPWVEDALRSLGVGSMQNGSKDGSSHD